MKVKLLALVAIVLVTMGLIGASTAGATGRIYFDGHVRPGEAISGTPRSTLWFSGVYSGAPDVVVNVGAIGGYIVETGCLGNCTVSFSPYSARAWFEYVGGNGITLFEGEERY